MAPVQSHHHMPGGLAYSTYLVIFKIHANSIRLFDSSSATASSKTPTYQVYCRDLEQTKRATEQVDANEIKVFVLEKSPATSNTADSRNLFHTQQPLGQELNVNDLALFMSPPIESSRKASYAIDLGIHDLGQANSSMEDLSSSEECKLLGTAYVYLEPKFSTQGVQRMQIISVHSKAPIGQLQVEYLIVTNPQGYGRKMEKPTWLGEYRQLDAGHRGAGSGCRSDLQQQQREGKKQPPITENTIASFNYAAQHGANACELDVMCTADGVPVVYHNYMLNTSEPLQIDELTLDELRQLQHKSIHDVDCKIHDHTITNYATPTDKSHQQFPTLEEVLRDVELSCALNIELKWAQIMANGKAEATHYREINDFVDRILDCIHKHNNGRVIMFSTLNPDIAILLRLKQTRYPVLFLTTGDSTRFNDPATKTVKNAIHFAQAFDMAGINPNAKWLNEFLVRYAKERGLLVYAWGDIKSAQTVRELRRYGLDGVIYDKIDLIKPKD